MLIIEIKEKDLITYDKKGNLKKIEPVTVLELNQRRHFKKGEFYMETFALNELILEKNYNSTILRILICLKIRLDFNNRIKSFKQSDLAREAKTSQPCVSRALKQLENDKIIYKDGLDYYFNDKFIKFAGDRRKKK